MAQVTVARVDSMGACESSVKRSRSLTANVIWRNSVPLAVKAARWTTADEIEEVEKPTVGRENVGAGETDRMDVLLEIGDTCCQW